MQRNVSLGPVAELQLDIDISGELPESGGLVRWGFLIGSGNIGNVVVIRLKKGDEVQTLLRVLERVRDEKGNWKEYFVREFPVPPGVDSGSWTVRYSHGQIELVHNKTHIGFAEFQNVEYESIRLILLESSGLQAVVDNLTVTGQQAKDWSAEDWALNNFSHGCDNMAQQNLQEGRAREAVQLLYRATRYRGQVFGEASVEFAISANFLGVALSRAGYSVEATQWFRDSLAILEKTLGEKHFQTATVMGNLGAELRLRGKALEAMPYLKRSLRSFETIAGNDGLQTMNAAANLSTAYEDVGELALAESYAQRAVRVRLRVLGEDHVETFASHALLARFYLRRNDAASAEPLVLKAMEIAKSIYPENHPDFAAADNLLAFYYFETEEFDKSAASAQRALNLAQKTLGPDHSSTREAGDLLDKIYQRNTEFPENKKDLAQAITQQQKLVAHRRSFHGQDHWLTKKSEVDLSTMEKLSQFSVESYSTFLQALHGTKVQELTSQGKLEEAIVEEEKALVSIEQLFGKSHILYVAMLERLAKLESTANKIREPAIKLGEALKIQESMGLNNEPFYAQCLKQLASLYGKAGLIDDAGSMLETSERIVNARITDKDTWRSQMQGIFDVYNELSGKAVEKEDYTRARATQAQELAIASRLYGEESWQARAVRWRMHRFEMLAKLTPEDHAKLKKTNELNFKSEEAEKAGDWKRAIQLRSEELAIREKILGANDEATTRTRTSMGEALIQENQFEDAIKHLELAVAARVENFGSNYPDLAISYSTLMNAYLRIGSFPAALRNGRLAVAIWKQTGEEGVEYATSLNNLAGLYIQTNDPASAAPLFREVAAILRKTSGTDSGLYAMSISNLATTYDALNDPRAEQTFVEAVELIRKVYGEDHPEFAMMQSKDAARMESSGDLKTAEQLYQSAILIYQRVMGENALQTLVNRASLAEVRLRLGRIDEAIETLRDVTDRIKEVYGESHPEFIRRSMSLADGLASAGKTDEAIRLLNDALTATRRQMDATSGEQSERQQMLFYGSLLHRLGVLLSLTDGMEEKNELVYNHLISWKGANFIRQRERRLLADDPKLRPIVEQLRTISSKLAALSYIRADDETSVVQQNVKSQLLKEREALETDLSRLVREQEVDISDEIVDASSVQRGLPEGTALVDFFIYFHRTRSDQPDTAKASGRRVVAFVTRPDRPVKRVDLGDAETIESAIHDWRQMIVQGGGELRGDGRRIPLKDRQPKLGELPQELLRNRIWVPVAPKLEGVDVVLLAPDGVLNLIPFGALPGRDENNYLLEERKFAIIPVPQLIPALLEKKEEPDENRTQKEQSGNSILIAGDIDFDALPGRSSSNQQMTSDFMSTRSGSTYFSYLPGTAKEIELIAEQFERSTDNPNLQRLEKKDATESQIRKLAPQSRFIHLATHGFFAEPDNTAALENVDAVASNDYGDAAGAAEQILTPAIFSGLAVAGANRGQSLSISGELSADDGILTAAEVAEIDLQGVELVVLSACETGLGKVTAGEGIMGLQRSFLVAGADTVISSLWQVDDAATQALMVEFYRNLLDKKLDKLEALRQAQLSLLRGELFQPPSLSEAGNPDDNAKMLPPRYWSAFSLSGDWR